MSFNDEVIKTTSKKIVILEIDRAVEERTINYAPGVWVKFISPGSEDIIDDFGNVGYYGNRTTGKKNIQSLNVGGEKYTEYASLALLETAGQGWFYDTATTKVYFILEDYNPPEYYVVVAPGAAIGFTMGKDETNDNYYEDIYYEPRLLSVSNLSKQKDPLQFGLIEYNTPTFELSNNDGFFDTYSTQQLYNQPYRVFLTFEGLAYSEALQVYEGKIKDFEHDFVKFRMIGKDAREALSRQLPINSFSNTDTTADFYFAGLADKDSGTPVPIIFGPVINVPAYRTSAGNWTFADTTDNAIDATIVVVDKDDAVFSHGGTGTDGTFTGADTTDKLYVTCEQSTIKNGLDVIKYCISEFEAIAFTAANYDTVEWNRETLNVKDIGLWIGKGKLKTTAEVIEYVCIDNQGVFDPLGDGKYTFRTYDKDRIPTCAILADEVLDDGAIKHPADQILSSVKIEYSEDLKEKESRIYENIDYEAEVYGIAGGYRELPKPYKTHLTSLADAIVISERIMEQSNAIPNNIELSTKTQNIRLRILDNLLYHYVRQNGNEVLARSRFQVLGVGLNLNDFEIDIKIKQIAEDDSTLNEMILGETETDMILGETGTGMILGIPYWTQGE